MALQPFFTTASYPGTVRSTTLKSLIAHGATKEEWSMLVDQMETNGETEFTRNRFRSAIEKIK